MFAFIMQCIVSFIATIAFAVLFHAPREQYLFCGIVGMSGWIVYWLIMQTNHPSTVLASFFGGITLTLLTRIFSIIKKTPATVYITTGIFPLVPGSGIYDTVYYFIQNMNEQASAKGIETFKIAVAIAFSIVLVLSIPSRFFYRCFEQTKN